MKTIIRSIIFLAVVSLSFSGLLYGQGPYTVDIKDANLVDGGDGKTSLEEAITWAAADAYNGHDVIVYFDVPPDAGNALCLLSSALSIDIATPGDGSITFDKHPNCTTEQGVEYTNASGISISNSTESSITIKNLTFNRPIDDEHHAICINSSFNITITGCDFFDNNLIKINWGDNIDITNNEFTRTAPFGVEGGYYCIKLDIDESSPLGEFVDISITDNTFNIAAVNSTVDNCEGDEPQYAVAYAKSDHHVILANILNAPQGKLEIKNNTIQTAGTGIFVQNYNPTTNPTGLDVDIISNTINSVISSMELVWPNNLWDISYNEFNISAGNFLQIDVTKYTDPGDVIGIDFIEENNNLNYIPKNNGNVFNITSGSYSASTDYAIFIAGTNASTTGSELLRLIGLDLPSYVAASFGYGATVRDCRITSTNAQKGPIFLGKRDHCYSSHWPIGNFNIPPVTAAATQPTVNIVDDDITVEFDLYNSLNQLMGNENAPTEKYLDYPDFVVDFYSSNANGDLLEYLGSSQVISNPGTNEQVTLIGAASKFLSTGFMAVTTTSVGTDPTNILGTSYAGYIPTSAIGDWDECPCISSFAPLVGKKYVLSAWVSEVWPGVSLESYPISFNAPEIRLEFPGASSAPTLIFSPKGHIIDGWQRIEEEFTIPSDATDIEVTLANDGSSIEEVYFDDIRIFPVDGNMKSFVYDNLTKRFVAELDENNYATFYEYDEDGALVRVKKETERGIMTIKETRKANKHQ